MKTAVLLLLALPLTLAAQTAAPIAPPPAAKPLPLYLDDPQALTRALMIAPPPAPGSAANQLDLAELHAIENKRTPGEIAAAQADSEDESIFLYHTLFDADFNAKRLPLTAALSREVHSEGGFSSTLLKKRFGQPRPYQLDNTLHPVCSAKARNNSYPSGHTISGYLEGLTLAAMLPEKQNEILARAGEFAHNRMVCGVHYPSDLEGGRVVAYEVFGSLMANPRFRQDLNAAAAELRTALHLPAM